MQRMTPQGVVLLWLLVVVPLIASHSPFGADAKKSSRARPKSPKPAHGKRDKNDKKRYIVVTELPAGFSGIASTNVQQDLVEKVKAQGVSVVDVAPKHGNVVSFVGDAATAKEVAANTGAQVSEDPPRWANGLCPGYTCPQCSSLNRISLNLEVTPVGLNQVQATDAVFLNLTGGAAAKGVTICMIDFGIDKTHQDLRGNNITGKGFYRNILFEWDKNFGQTHGQHVLGTMVAARNGRGIVGVIGGGANVYAVNIFGNNSRSNGWNLVWAWDACYAELLLRQKTDPLHKMVVHMSLGGPDNSFAERAMLQYMYKTGNILFFSSTGNDKQLKDNFPASYDEVIGVSAVNCKNQISDFSNSNADVELTAPGVNILSDYPSVNTETSGLANLRVIVPRGTPAPPCVEVRNNYDGILTRGPVTGRLVDCGSGVSCRAARGQICIIDFRPDGAFSPCNRVRRCMAFGARAAILVAQDCGTDYFDVDCTEEDCSCGTTPPIPSVGVSTLEGAKLRAYLRANAATIVNGTMSFNKLYEINDGTSMSTPHVSAIAAKLWSRFRKCTNDIIRKALTTTALDLGPPGRDVDYGFGLVQGRKAAEWLRTQPCARP